MKAVIKLSIIIVNYNSSDFLKKCLASLYQSNPTTPFEVLVVDNSSSDNSVEMVRRDFPQITLIENKENIGFAPANNQALQRCRGEFVLFLNPDTMLLSGSVDALVETMQKGNKVGILGCRLLNEDGTLQLSWGRMVNLANEFWQRFISRRYEKGNRLITRHLQRKSRQLHHPHWVTGACMLARREALEEVGDFDQNFFMFLEDVDLCHRIRKKGWEILYTPSAEVIHLRGKSMETNRAAALKAYRKSQLHFYRKHYGRVRWTMLRIYLLCKFTLSRLASRLAYFITRKSQARDNYNLSKELLSLVARAKYSADEVIP
ncbi:MAG: glycosyltransferase family 2 protein [Candidatus Aminicenantes bacterium]|nr:glycosyltransferase family 2 protein [Candidatus Aminicenantes bacterium]MDH5714407.1 glycosyltransferase family 2 protein [Candidatus Aminicenantes bacterium]